MNHYAFHLFAVLFISICMLSSTQRLPGLGDFIAITKILNLPYNPYFLPELPTPKRTKLFGLPPLFMHPPVTQSPDLPNRTIAPLLKLFTLPLITLPPPPKIDKYGINTIPELPPQHESIYEGMFAPDGSLNKIYNSTKKDAKETETNQIYDQNGLQRSDESLRDTRATNIRIAAGPIVNDDYQWYADEDNIGNHEESVILTKFLRGDTHHNKNNVNTSLESNSFSSNDIAIEITTTETIEPSVKSSTATRLQVLISDENDAPTKKYENFELASKTEDGKPHRIFPRSDQSPIQINPVPQHSENGTIIHFSIWQKHKNRTLHRTTIQPNVHFVIHDGEIDRNEVATLSKMKSKSAPRANSLPKGRNEFVLQQHESKEGSNNLAQKLQPMNLISQKLHEKNNLKMNAQPTVVVPAKQYYDWNNKYQIEQQFPQHRPQQQQQFPQYQFQQQPFPQYHFQQQQFPQYQSQQQQSPQFQPQQQIPQYQQQSLQYHFQRQSPQYQQQQQQSAIRDPKDDAYLHEVEEYDHFWEKEHARNAAYYQPQTKVTISPNYQPVQMQQQQYPLMTTTLQNENKNIPYYSHLTYPVQQQLQQWQGQFLQSDIQTTTSSPLPSLPEPLPFDFGKLSETILNNFFGSKN